MPFFLFTIFTLIRIKSSMKFIILIIIFIWIPYVIIPAIAEKGCGMSFINRIVGGEDAMAGEFPFMAILFVKNSDLGRFDTFNVYCGGSLISRNVVLTAAHCFDEQPWSHFLIRLGAFDILKGSRLNPREPVDIFPKSATIHENYSKITMKNDIALVKLQKSVVYSMFILPICLPVNNLDDDFVGNLATVAGWGRKSYRGRAAQLLQKVTLKVVSVADCNVAYKKQDITLAYGTICAGFIEGEKDACQGDSGGPLMLPVDDLWTIIGVVSVGYKCAEPGYYGIYTRVTEYIDWIQNNMD